jgi:hypothetical protein
MTPRLENDQLANKRRLAMARSRTDESAEAGSEEDDEATSMPGSQFGAYAARSPRLL